MNFSAQPPSKQWSVLKYSGAVIAEVWFKPDGEPLALTFRVPQQTFSVPGMDRLLTAENLLKAVGIAAGEVEAWHHEGASPADSPESAAELSQPLPPPGGSPHQILRISLRMPHSEAPAASGDSAIPEHRWQAIEARWNAILGLEASIDTLRISMESLRAEMDSASRRTMSPDEKVHALNADIAQWSKAKSRVLFAMPKAKEFIHRSTWAAGAADRKRIGELVETYIQPRIPFPELNQVVEQMENLLKDRQVLSAHGTAAYQDCKSASADLQATFRTLQSNAVANAAKKRAATHKKGKFV